MKKLAIIGAGDLAQQMAHYVEKDSSYKVAGFFDDYAKKGALIKNKPILGKIEDLNTCFEENIYDELLLGIGYKHLEFREKIYKQYQNKIPFANVIHSSTIIDSSCELGEGIFIYPGCNIDMNTKIGSCAILYNDCVLSHDSKIGDFSILSPSVKIAGFVEIGKSASLGIGTVIIDNIKIVDNVKTGASTTITKDLLKKGLYVGCPAKFLRDE